MKRLICGALIVFTAIITTCKKESDILATYKTGSITRGEFYKWLEARRFPKETTLKSKKKQKDKLKKMMLEKVTIEKAKEEGLDKTEEFKTRKDIIIEGQVFKFVFEKLIGEKLKFKEPAIRVRHIFLGVKDYKIERNKKIKLEDDEILKEFEKATAKAKNLIERLNKGEKFEELAKNNSTDFSKRKGGDLGYIIYDIMPPEYSKIAFSLKEGEHTKEPVKTAKGLYIIKIEDRKDLTEKNINDKIEDKSQAKRITNVIKRKFSKEYMDQLMEAEDTETYFDRATSKKKSDVIFKIGDKLYTVENLDNMINLRRSIRRESRKDLPKITDEQKKRMANSYFKYEILRREAINKGMYEDPDYIREMELRTGSILERDYNKKIFESNIVIPKEEMLEEYNKNKERSYFKMIRKNKKKQKVIQPFSAVKDKIEKKLRRTNRYKKLREWQQKVIKEYDFNIAESKLEGE